jgi:hypothetical protein
VILTERKYVEVIPEAMGMRVSARLRFAINRRDGLRLFLSIYFQ